MVLSHYKRSFSSKFAKTQTLSHAKMALLCHDLCLEYFIMLLGVFARLYGHWEMLKRVNYKRRTIEKNAVNESNYCQ